ncbi:hypothetical protein C5167_009833 [Papaver somniferum]|uniref:Uncharacterized protein n=1 Tax=Papaver somniferum TaxID=3469 RepID=A0A4Y7K2K1_PAPSO|nr:hypothetical protein C5167_009833 [Papaver somniferum]
MRFPPPRAPWFAVVPLPPDPLLDSSFWKAENVHIHLKKLQETAHLAKAMYVYLVMLCNNMFRDAFSYPANEFICNIQQAKRIGGYSNLLCKGSSESAGEVDNANLDPSVIKISQVIKEKSANSESNKSVGGEVRGSSISEQDTKISVKGSTRLIKKLMSGGLEKSARILLDAR